MPTEPVLVKNRGWVFVAFWAFTSVVFTFVAFRAYQGAETRLGRIVGTTLFGVLAAGVAFLAVDTHRHPQRLIVSDESITSGVGHKKAVSIRKSAGGELRFVTEVIRVGHSRSQYWVITQTGTDVKIGIQNYHRDEVEQACRDHGWSFAPIAA